MWILILPLFHTSLFLKYENSRLKCTMATSTLKPENLRPRCTKVTFKRPACQSILASPTCVQATPSTPIPCRVLGEPPPPSALEKLTRSRAQLRHKSCKWRGGGVRSLLMYSSSQLATHQTTLWRSTFTPLQLVMHPDAITLMAHLLLRVGRASLKG